MTNEKKFDIYDRVLKFAARVAKFIEQLPKTLASVEYGRQVIKSSGSIGANMEEADGAVSKRDFTNKVGIARKEARESRHWLSLIKATGLSKTQEAQKELDLMISEARELVLILSSIINKTNSN